MPEAMQFDKLLEGIRTTDDFARLDASLTKDALHSIRAEFDTKSDPFERHRAICAQIAAARSPELRRMLIQVREAFETRMLSAAIGEVYQAFGRSPEEGWNAWLTKLSAALSAFHLRHSMRLCKDPFPFEPSRKQALVEIRRAVECICQGRWEEAYDGIHFLSKLESVPAHSRARFVMLVGQIDLFRFEDPELAQQRFDEAKRIAPDDGVVLASYGGYWLAQKDIRQATECYERAIALAPRDANGYVGMGERFEKDETLDEAVRLEKATWWYREAVSKAGGDFLGHSRLLGLLGRRVTLQEHEFLTVVHTKLAVDPESEYETYLDVGQSYMTSKDFPKAREWFEKALKLEKHWPLAFMSLAELCRAQGNDEEAEDLCKRAMEVAPDYPGAYILLARRYEEQSRWREALEIYARFPEQPRQWGSFARTAKGRMHAKLEEYDEAERILRDELRRCPEEPYAQRALEAVARDRYQRHKDKQSAKRIYDEILRTVGERYSGSYHNLLGNMHFELDDYASAVDEYREAIVASPGEATYHRNLSSAYESLGDYDSAEGELRNAYQIDRDEKLLRQKRAGLANTKGNHAYERAAYGDAIKHYTTAIELAPSQAIYHKNLAGAWERLKETGKRVQALDQALLCYERAQEITKRQDHTERIERLRRRKQVARAHGEKALDYVNVVTPIAVEVAADLIRYVEGDTKDKLSTELSSSVNIMRARVLEQLGVKIPGIRFRGNETDLPNGTYIVMINEIPLVSGNLSPGRWFCTDSEEVLSSLGVKGDPAFDPVSGQEGAWIDSKDCEKVRTQQLWGIMEYLTRHVEAVVRKNVGEFLGHQEIVNLLERESVRPFEEIRASSRMVTALTTVCRSLVAEEVPIHPFSEVCATFKDLYTNSVGLRDIVEHIRLLPAFRERLPGNDGQHSFMKLSTRFEAVIRRSLYERDGRLILAMEPEQCQEALTAVRNEVNGRPLALVVDDAVLRPFVRKLIELEFPNLRVLSLAELRTDAEIVPFGSVDLDDEPSAEHVEFKNPRRVDTMAMDPERVQGRAAAIALSDIGVEVFVGENFETQASAADDKPMEMFSMLQDGLFYELGIILPEVQLRIDRNLKLDEFRIRLNGVEYQPVAGLGHDEFLVNDTVDRLNLLGVKGREAVNPANGNECAVVRNTQGQAETCRQAGLTTWGPRGFIVLTLSSEIRKAAARFQSDEVTQYILDSLGEAFPDLVSVAQERYTIPEISLLFRELLDEEISIRDLRGILESLLSIDGTTDVDWNRFIVFLANSDCLCPVPAPCAASDLTAAQLADFVRMNLRRYISHKYTRGGNTLVVYLLDRAIEKRLAEIGARPLAVEEKEKLQTAIDAEVGNLSPTANSPVVLTTFEIRRALRKTIDHKFPRLAVLSYQELSPDLNIQPIARISWN